MRIVLAIAYVLIGAGFVERAFTYQAPWSWLAGVIAAMMLILAYGTARKTWWGVNPEKQSCQSCGTKFPKWGGNRSFKQMMFGGRTCPNCGCVTDQWGCEVVRNGTAPTAR